MTPLLPTQPLLFEPIFQERVWGGRRLESMFRKKLPPGKQIGESWEIVDRPEAQSVVREGPWRGRTLHDLWLENREELFGEIADSARFPLLIKLLDAEETLSLQVHPPAARAEELGGEAKTEFWYIVQAASDAKLYVGLQRHSSRAKIEQALRDDSVAEHLHAVAVREGDAMFLPSGRMHAIGAGNVIIEIQQNSDTTYRVFDWNRVDASGVPRALHLEESLRSINFDDYEPALVSPVGESLVRDASFEVEKWELHSPRAAADSGTFAIVGCVSGAVGCGEITIKPGEFLLVPATLKNRMLEPRRDGSSLLRVTIPLQK